jgi:hypothetical protein
MYSTQVFLFVSTLNFSPSHSSPSPPSSPSSSPTPAGLEEARGEVTGQKVGTAGGRLRVLATEEAAELSRGCGGREEGKKEGIVGTVGSRRSSTAAELWRDPTTLCRGDGHWAAAARQEEEEDNEEEKIKCLDTRARHRQTRSISYRNILILSFLLHFSIVA